MKPTELDRWRSLAEQRLKRIEELEDVIKSVLKSMGVVNHFDFNDEDAKIETKVGEDGIERIVSFEGWRKEGS